jgi:large subunit ribosomal protein L10
MNRDEKVATIEALRERFSAADSAFFVDFRGLKVSEVTELRSLLRREAGRMLVVKNTFAGIAARGTGFDGIEQRLQGPTAVVFATEARNSAKVLTDFARAHENLAIKFCALRGRILEGKEAESLATLPSREELLSRVLGLINAPASRLLAQVNSPGQQIVSVLQAWIEKRREAMSGEGSAGLGPNS